MDRIGAHTLVTQLFKDRPEKFQEVLTRCCESEKVCQDIIYSCLLEQRPTQYEQFRQPNRLDITFAPPASPSLQDSHYSGSSPPRPRLPRRLSSKPTPFTPLSPPRTASSLTSLSSKDEINSGDYILLLDHAENDVKEHLVRMKAAPIKYSVICEDVVQKRHLDAYLRDAQEYHVSVPNRAAAEMHTIVPVSCSMELTWRRPRSDSTHETTFFVVPKDLLGIDILLGYEDSGEGIQEYQPTVVPQPQRRHNSIIEEYQRNVRPQAPTPPAASYHRSAMTGNESARATPVHNHDERFRPHRLVEDFISQQQVHNATMEDYQHSHHSPPATVLGSQSSRIAHPQPLRHTAAPSTTAQDVDHNTNNARLKLTLIWDATTVNVPLSLDAPGEAFFKDFQHKLGKRKSIVDRSMMTIYMKRDKHAPDDEAYALSLDEDDLEAYWETTVTWLEENRRVKPPHIHGKIQIEDG